MHFVTGVTSMTGATGVTGVTGVNDSSLSLTDDEINHQACETFHSYYKK